MELSLRSENQMAIVNPHENLFTVIANLIVALMYSESRTNYKDFYRNDPTRQFLDISRVEETSQREPQVQIRKELKKITEHLKHAQS